ncbi:probable voltage-gated chloride channel (clc-a) [Ceraceosorus bombacis]|uniref:Chloride channel protein n=1 Tax=Ceraceosorus bombacis TaxID=401625 RepID=A0A0N7LAH8_9BASI|nr:probable voltage-gated chloride channel (clc-a) [Ceraceosorus bombacis]
MSPAAPSMPQRDLDSSRNSASHSIAEEERAWRTVTGGGGVGSSSALSPNAAAASSSAVRTGISGGGRSDVDDDALDEIRRYESFSTVDWIADSRRERARLARQRLAEAKLQSDLHGLQSGGSTAWGPQNRFRGNGGFAGGRIPTWWPEGPWGRIAWKCWLLSKQAARGATESAVVVGVGVLIGVNMAVISIATEWASDIKQGYCRSGWWLNQKFCCWEMMDPAGPGGSAIPPPAVKTAATAAATSSPSSSAAHAALARMAEHAGRAVGLVANAGLGELERRAANPDGGDLSETCTDWIPWSTWTLPAWIIYVLFAAGLSALCAHLVRSFAPYAAGPGIAEIKCILAGFIINGFLGFWTFLIKSLTLPLAIASGLSVGKEGPAVHVACCIGNIVAQFVRSFDRSQARMRELLTAASAAGVAVAFGSPIGGVLFSLEEMAHNFPASTMWRSFLCALAATVALSFMNPFRTGKLVLFQVSYDRDWHYFEILFFSLIGIFGGLYGAVVIKYNLQVQQFRRTNLAAHGVAEAVVLATLTAFVGYWNKFLRIDMSESLEILFRECEGGGDYDGLCQGSAQWRMVNSLLIATFLRLGLVILSYGCKVPAGIFVPSMAIGATFGRMIGILVKALYTAFPNAALFSACEPDVPCITPGTYAFLGAAAALAGVTRITVAVVVIMFELTGALTYILPTMLVVMITKGVGDLYGKGGISEQTIKFQGYPFLDKDDHVFGLPVGDIMTRSPACLNGNEMQLSDVEARLAEGAYKGLPVVRSTTDSTLLGYAGKTEMRYAIAKARRTRPNLSDDTKCNFTSDADLLDAKDTAVDQQHLPTPLLDRFEGIHAEEQAREELLEGAERSLLGAHGEDDDELDEVDESMDHDTLELGGWMEQTPLCVQPSMPLEVVMDLFKKMGPRVVLVTRLGRLVGLVTVKDVLKHVAAQEHEARRGASSSSASSPNPGGAGAEDSIFGGDLELALSDLYAWTRRVFKPLSVRVSRFVDERSGRSTRNYASVRGNELPLSRELPNEPNHWVVGDE